MKNLTIALALSILPILTSCSRAEKSSYEIKAPQQQIDHSHAAFTDVLSKHLKDGRFDYAALNKNPAPLNAYLDTLAAVPESAYKKWTVDQRMAFLINLYNAATIKLIIDHYPLESIKDIGGIFKGPWKQDVVRLWGEIVTLDHVEHDLLRPRFDEPRIHFAVNCASIGCPDLRDEAFRAADLEKQLEEQTRKFVRDRSRNRLDAGDKTLYLSPLFDWFEEDFVNASGSVEKVVAPYFNEKDRAVIRRGDMDIEHTDYDWSLNEP
jgi:hypothetical protein